MAATPHCIIVTGRPGAGKTTLSKELGRWLCLPVICRDELKEGYVTTFGVRHDQLPPDTNLVVTNLFFDTALRLLSSHVSIVIEAAFQHALWASRMPALQHVSRVSMVVCVVPDEVAAARHLQRGLDDPRREFFHGDKRVADHRATGVLGPAGPYERPRFDDVPTVEVSTMAGYVPALDVVADFVRSERRDPAPFARG